VFGDEREEFLAESFHFDRAETAHVEQHSARCGLGGNEFVKGGVIENDIRRNSSCLCLLLAPLPNGVG